MKTIPLSRGLFALVDDCDYDWLMQWKWQATITAAGKAYAARSFRSKGNRRFVKMHRLIMDAPAGLEVDHRNRDGLDNQRHNLRLCTHGQNQANGKKYGPDKSSRFKGVSRAGRRGEKWQARITHCGRTHNLGRYDLELEAADAYDAAAKELFGGFAYTNDMAELGVEHENRLIKTG